MFRFDKNNLKQLWCFDKGFEFRFREMYHTYILTK